MVVFLNFNNIQRENICNNFHILYGPSLKVVKMSRNFVEGHLVSPDCSSLEEREAALHEEDDDGDDDQEELVAGPITDQYCSEWTNQRSVL